MVRYLQQRIDFNSPQVASVFDELSFWSSRFGALLFEQIELQAGMTILDVGCGTGFPLFEMAHTCGDSCYVVGVDIWGAALSRATSKLKLYNLPNVSLVQADATTLPFTEAAFDLVVSNLGINNFADPGAMLAECFRVMRPGGKLALTTNLRGHMREFYEVYRGVLGSTHRDDYLLRLEANEAHRGTQESLRRLLEGAGFRIIREVAGSFTLRYLDGTALLNHSLTRFGFLEGWRSVVDPADEVVIFSSLEAQLNEQARQVGELRMTIPTLYIEGERPQS